MRPLLELDLRVEPDVLLARQRAREVAAALGLDAQDQARTASAVCGVGRDVLAAGGGRVAFDASAGSLEVAVTASAPTGAPTGPPTGAGAGAGAGAVPPDTGAAVARGLVDDVRIGRDGAGHRVVTLVQRLPAGARVSSDGARERIRGHLRAAAPATALGEAVAQDRELADALARVRAQRAQLEQVNAELEHTNRGVVALYAELDEKSEQVRRADEAKSRFLASVSHELRTPVNSVLGLSRLLLDPTAAPLTDEQAHQVHLVQASAQDLLGLVDELLDLAKAESGRLEPVLGEVRLRDLWAELADTLAPLAQPGVELVVEEPGPDVPPAVTTDAVLLRQVLRNLLTNALKFTEHGSVRLSAHTRAGRLVLVVADTGVGIAPEHRDHVFEEFFQVRGPLQVRSRGTGLGLPHARRLVELLGGSLRLDSEVGRGTVLTADLPVHAGPPGDVPGGLTGGRGAR